MRMEGMQFVSAGTDTVSNTLHNISWHLSQNPELLKTLREELKTVQPDPYTPATLQQLEQLPYLTGVIYEGLRLGYGVSNRSARVAPDRVIKYKDWDIPPGTVSLHIHFLPLGYQIHLDPLPLQPQPFPQSTNLRFPIQPITLDSIHMHTSPTAFPDPTVFDPTRWTTPSERNRLDKYMVAFSKGTRICIGINLAWAELYMITSTVFSRFDIEMTAGTNFEDHVKFNKDLFFPQPRVDAGRMKVLIR